MNWDQIESKWADMTRRVRGDWPAAIKQSSLQGAPLRRDTTRIAVAPLPPQQADIRLSETDALQAE